MSSGGGASGVAGCSSNWARAVLIILTIRKMAADVAEAYAEARRIMDFTDGCKVDVGRGGEIVATPLELVS